MKDGVSVALESFNPADRFNIIAFRGDLVRLNHDIPFWGLGYGRITSVESDSSGITGINLDSEVPMGAGTNYAVRIRQSNNDTLVEQVVTNDGSQTFLEFSTPLADSSDNPQAGDLCLFGELGNETVELLIIQIKPRNDFVAEISAVDYSPAVYSADGSDTQYSNSLIAS